MLFFVVILDTDLLLLQHANLNNYSTSFFISLTRSRPLLTASTTATYQSSND